MTTYLTNYLDSRYKTYENDNYNGVVRISYNGYYGTGMLLYDGVSILTAAHLFSSTPVSASQSKVLLQTPTGNVEYNTSNPTIYDYYDPANANGDLAIVKLDAHAPADAHRYELYRNSDEIGKDFTLVGYGEPGSGAYGVDTNYHELLKLKSQNSFDADFLTIKQSPKTAIAWTPWEGSQLAADFDDTTSQNDTIGYLTDTPNIGLGVNEGLIAPGDSGGPAFINNKVAGVATYVTALDNSVDSSFGDIAAWQRVSYFQKWIDQTIRAGYTDAPTCPQDVIKNIEEGSAGDISTNYFLVQYLGIRDAISDNITLEYTTRDGTAVAGSDYIATSGELVIYPDETQVAIPVEIIGDNIYEADEYFYMDISNPSYGSLGEGVVKLTAMRTILNDDLF